MRRRTRWLAWLAWLSIAASACGAAHHPARDPGPDAGSLPLCPSPPPPDQPLALDSRLPCDIGPASAPDGGVTDRSAQFATFSWNSFIALMWPTDAQGRAAPALGRYDPAWPAWTHWTSRRSFDLGEQPPVASAPVPRVLSDADIDQVVPADIAGSVLWDRSLRPVYYEVVYNSDLAQVIQAQKLGSLAQQLARWSPRTLQVTLPPTPQALGPLLAPTPVGTLVPGTSAGRWVFQAQDTGATTCLDTFQSGVDQLDVYPATWQSGSWFRGGLALPWGNPARTPPSLGSVVLKLAWKVLDPEAGDISARFLHLPATIVHGDQRQEHVEVGLVGLHIAHKTLSAMTWAWSTFEHIDNVPLETGRPTTERTYTFYDPHCRDCPVNTPSTTPRASQLLRVLPIDPGTRALNERAARQLAALDTVLAYYRLVGTQWPTDPGYAAGIAEPCLTSDLAPAPSGKPSPAALTNPVIESFTQEASCMDCHARASIASARAPGGRALFERPGSADFLFLFRHAP